MQEKNSKSDITNFGMGERIKLLRKISGINQQQLADEMGLKTAVAISKYESGMRKVDYLKLSNMATFFNIDIEWLITGFVPESFGSGIKEKLNDLNINKAEFAKKTDVTEKFIDALTECEIMPSAIFIEKAFKIFYGDNYFVNIGQHNENENIASLKNEIISLRGKLEQCEKNFTDVRREYLERIETILSKKVQMGAHRIEFKPAPEEK